MITSNLQNVCWLVRESVIRPRSQSVEHAYVINIHIYIYIHTSLFFMTSSTYPNPEHHHYQGREESAHPFLKQNLDIT